MDAIGLCVVCVEAAEQVDAVYMDELSPRAAQTVALQCSDFYVLTGKKLLFTLVWAKRAGVEYFLGVGFNSTGCLEDLTCETQPSYLC